MNRTFRESPAHAVVALQHGYVVCVHVAYVTGYLEGNQINVSRERSRVIRLCFLS